MSTSTLPASTANAYRTEEYKAGFRAGLRGGRLAECNYKEQPRYQLWELGWHMGTIRRKKQQCK